MVSSDETPLAATVNTRSLGCSPWHIAMILRQPSTQPSSGTVAAVGDADLHTICSSPCLAMMWPRSAGRPAYLRWLWPHIATPCPRRTPESCLSRPGYRFVRPIAGRQPAHSRGCPQSACAPIRSNCCVYSKDTAAWSPPSRISSRALRPSMLPCEARLSMLVILTLASPPARDVLLAIYQRSAVSRKLLTADR